MRRIRNRENASRLLVIRYPYESFSTESKNGKLMLAMIQREEHDSYHAKLISNNVDYMSHLLIGHEYAWQKNIRNTGYDILYRVEVI